MILQKSQVIDKCQGCKKVGNDNFCTAYVSPFAMWPPFRMGSCPMCTTIVRKVEEVKKMNPLKASKKKAKK